MAVVTSSLSGWTEQLQKFFSKQLIQHAVQELRLMEFAKKVNLPKNAGAKTVSVFRRVAGASSNVQSLTEGTPISTFTSVTYTEVNMTLAQIGEAIKYTDIVSYVQLLDVLKDGIALMGEDCALKADDLVSTALASGLTTKRYGQATADWTTLAAGTAAAGKIIATDLLDSCTQLKVNRAPRINGDYVMISAPQVTRDMQNDGDWIEAARYAGAKQIFKGEVGSLHGVRVVEATNPWREGTGGAEGTYDASGGIYMNVVTGKDCYAFADISTQSPNAPKIIVLDKADKADPLNQFMTAGWKGYAGAKVLNASFGIALRTRTAFA